MNSWRGALVLLAAGMAGSGGMLAWVFTLQHEWMPLKRTLPADKADLLYLLAVCEGLAFMLGPAFGTGQLTARALLHRDAAEEIARSGRWRLIPLYFATGALTLVARFSIFPFSQLWSLSHLAAMSLGVALVAASAREAWVHWIAPRLKRSCPACGHSRKNPR